MLSYFYISDPHFLHLVVHTRNYFSSFAFFRGIHRTRWTTALGTVYRRAATGRWRVMCTVDRVWIDTTSTKRPSMLRKRRAKQSSNLRVTPYVRCAVRYPPMTLHKCTIRPFGTRGCYEAVSIRSIPQELYNQLSSLEHYEAAPEPLMLP